MAHYINPYTDFGFKKLFGEEGNKDLLVDFLNELLPEYHKIAVLNFKNSENLGDVPSERKAIFDIHCQSVSGERFIVEMQKAKVNFFKDRSLFYSTFPIREQADQGIWDFQLSPVYFIAVLDFHYDEKEEIRKFRRDVALKDQDGDLFFDKLHFKFLQMPFFTKKEHELDTHFDKWCYFLKNLETFDDIPAILKEPIFVKAFETSRLAALSPAEREEYEKSRLSYHEVQLVSDTAKLDRTLEIAKNAIAAGLQDEIIVAITGLSLAQVQKLRKNH
jgi:predicted transposase/invertase (TIGR01784 family)